MSSQRKFSSPNPVQRLREAENEILNLKIENKRLKQELASYKNRQGQPVVPKFDPVPKPIEKEEEKPRVTFWGGKKEEDS